MSNNLELDVSKLNEGFAKVKSDITKLIQEIDKINKKLSVLPPSVIYSDQKPRSGDDYFFNGDGHFIS